MALSSATLPTRKDAAPLPERLMRFLRTPKGTLLPMLLVLLAVTAPVEGASTVLPHVVAAVAGACLAEVIASVLVGRRVEVPTSALLSGLILAFVLAPQEAITTTFTLGALATASKYVIRTGREHVFNPAAFALVLSVPVFASGQSWWGALPDLSWPWVLLMVALGAFLADRLNKFPSIIAFAGAYFGLFTLVALARPASVAEMFRDPFVQSAIFFAFFMLTDPPTSPGRVRDQVWFGIVVGAASVVAQLVGVGQTYMLVGLLAGNAVLAVSRIAIRQRVGSTQQPAKATAAAGRGGPTARVTSMPQQRTAAAARSAQRGNVLPANTSAPTRPVARPASAPPRTATCTVCKDRGGCPHCGGSGLSGSFTCRICRGQGWCPVCHKLPGR